jgi:CTP:molybdopterin cytidylyltransferase MocA
MIEGLDLGPAAVSRLHAPAGLDIGAETADEIALSIVAEVQAVTAGRSGASLRERPGRIHDGHPVNPVRKRDHPRFGAVVLAAGASTRLGQPKQLVMYEGQPLVVRAALAALRSGANPVVVVVGAHADAVRAALFGLPVTLVTNPAWADGVGTSVAAGVRALRDSVPDVRGVLLTLADQPLVDSSALVRLADAWLLRATHSRPNSSGETAVAAAVHAHTVGAPAIFGRASFEQLCALGGDAGAARLLRTTDGHVRRVYMPEAAVDVDTPDDLLRLGVGNGSPAELAEPLAGMH